MRQFATPGPTTYKVVDVTCCLQIATGLPFRVDLLAFCYFGSLLRIHQFLVMPPRKAVKSSVKPDPDTVAPVPVKRGRQALLNTLFCLHVADWHVN